MAVLDNDYVYGSARDIGDLPKVLVPLCHYFETCKLVPETPAKTSVERVHGRAPAPLSMVNTVLADAVVGVHFLFLLFVVFGGFLVLRWPRLAWVHLPCALWGALIEFAGSYVP